MHHFFSFLLSIHPIHSPLPSSLQTVYHSLTKPQLTFLPLSSLPLPPPPLQKKKSIFKKNSLLSYSPQLSTPRPLSKISPKTPSRPPTVAVSLLPPPPERPSISQLFKLSPGTELPSQVVVELELLLRVF